MRSYEDSLQRLGVNHIDILYVHDIDVPLSKEANPKAMYRKWVKSAYKALDELRRNGDIKAIGFGINVTQPIVDSLDLGQWDVFLLAGRYTLLEQAPLTTLFPALKKHGASILVGGPFNSGILAGGNTFNYAKAPRDVVARVRKIRPRYAPRTMSPCPRRHCNSRSPIRSSPALFPVRGRRTS